MIIYCLIFSNVGILAEGIIGLDSIKIHKQASITILKKDANNTPLDTVKATLKIFDREEKEVPEILIAYSNESDVVRIVSGDTTNILNISDKSFRNYYSTELSTGREVSIFYHYLYLKRNVHYFFTDLSKEKEINTKTSINPSERIIKFESQSNSIESGVTSIHELSIFTENFDSLEFTGHVLKDNDSINQLSVKYIYSNNIDTNKINKLNDIYADWNSNKFILEQIDILKTPQKSEFIGKALNTEFIFEGLNREDFYLQDEISKNNYTIIYTWGTWCRPCMMNTDNINEFVSNNDIPFFSVMFEFEKKPKQKMIRYLDENNPSYPIYRSDNFIKDNEIMQFPAFLLVNSKGEIVDAFDGKAKNSKDYIELVKRNIKKD